MNFDWNCPKCGADANKCGKKPTDMCDGKHGDESCMGFICECDTENVDEAHGQSLEYPCPEANCYHCGWGGKFPKPPRGLQAWEKKALEAGWTPPPTSVEELKQK